MKAGRSPSSPAISTPVHSEFMPVILAKNYKNWLSSVRARSAICSSGRWHVQHETMKSAHTRRAFASAPGHPLLRFALMNPRRSYFVEPDRPKDDEQPAIQAGSWDELVGALDRAQTRRPYEAFGGGACPGQTQRIAPKSRRQRSSPARTSRRLASLIQRDADRMNKGVQSVGDRARGQWCGVLGPKPVKIARCVDHLVLVPRLRTLQPADRQSEAAVDDGEIECQAAH